MKYIPSYQVILLILIISLLFELFFEKILKIRSKAQNFFNNKNIYMITIIIIIFIISILIDNLVKDNVLNQIGNIFIIGLLIFLMDLSNFKKRR